MDWVSFAIVLLGGLLVALGSLWAGIHIERQAWYDAAMKGRARWAVDRWLYASDGVREAKALINKEAETRLKVAKELRILANDIDFCPEINQASLLVRASEVVRLTRNLHLLEEKELRRKK